MILNNENYYSPEANQEYMSVSQYKAFMNCEAAAMASISGKYERPTTRALLVGSFVDRYFEGTLNEFLKENPALYTRKHELRAEFKRANQIIETVKTDPKFMDAMSGEKQRIFTFELFGVKWKAKLDSYNPGKAITDLKVVARMDKLPMWRYDLQGAIYQKGVEIVTGEKLPFYLAVVTKERVMDRDIWQIPQSTLDMALRQVEENIGRYADIKGFCIGEYSAYEFPAYVDGNKFFQRHACIVGNTGAGKSETVAKILEQTSKLPGANVIVFDIHGEYKELSYARNIQIGGDRPFPIWMFGFTDMISNILKIKEESATVAMTALRKCYYNVCPKGKENRPVYFNYVEFVKLMKFLDEEMVGTGEVYKTGAQAGKEKIVKGDYNGKLTNIVNLLVDKARDSKYQFLFEDMPQQYLYDFMKDVLNNDVPVKNIDLSEVPHDVAIPIIGVITKLVYEIQRTYKSKDVNPVTLVCDEAHVYIPNDFSLSASQRRMVEIFENIAKEGRKFGVTLFPASQRPSELNKTIMAQCANFIVGKMNNENDKAMIKGMMPEGSESVIDETSMFSPGDVFVIGDAVPIPLKIHVALAEERPQSRTIAFWDRWKNAGAIDVTDATTKYITG